MFIKCASSIRMGRCSVAKCLSERAFCRPLPLLFDTVLVEPFPHLVRKEQRVLGTSKATFLKKLTSNRNERKPLNCPAPRPQMPRLLLTSPPVQCPPLQSKAQPLDENVSLISLAINACVRYFELAPRLVKAGVLLP